MCTQLGWCDVYTARLVMYTQLGWCLMYKLDWYRVTVYVHTYTHTLVGMMCMYIHCYHRLAPIACILTRDAIDY